jgi:hypothetical protein
MMSRARGANGGERLLVPFFCQNLIARNESTFCRH